MVEAKLPIAYLGLPLFSSRMHVSDCAVLIYKICNKLSSWKAFSLSFAGELLKSTIFNLQLYWSNAFLLPKSCLADIEKAMHRFLWRSQEGRKIHSVS